MKKLVAVGVSVIAAAVLLACGGGGGSASTTQSLSGVAATGAPIAGATITVKDSTGALVGTATADANGSYSISYDSTRFTPPFVIRADGQSGDAGISLVGVASSSGTANVTQLSNAMASSLSSTGNPLDLSSSPTGLTASAITAADAAYGAALANVMSVHGVTGSLLSGQYTAAFDKLLDNVSATVQPSGQVIVGTTAGKVGNDLVAGSTASSPYTTLVLQSRQLPTANSAASLVAPSSSSFSLGITDLEALRSKLEACFALATADRGTPQSPAAACADVNFVATSDITQTDGFRHSGYRWNNTAYDPTQSRTSTYWAGLFGYMLTQSKYDGAKFLSPKIVRPLDALGTTWVVRFPIKFADGTVDTLGEAIRSPFAVVKKISTLVSSNDNGYRLVGDQRDFNSFVLPTIQKVTNQVTGDYRYETGLNVQVINVLSSTDSANRKPVMAKITGKGLPVGGVYLAQKANAACGLYLPITGYGQISNNSAGNWANVDTTYGCAGVFVMAINYSGTYNSVGNSVRYLANLGNNGYGLQSGVNSSGTLSGLTTGVGNYLTDSDVASIGEGEPYTFVITLSDGSTVTYINRLPTRPLSATEAAAFSYYPTFDASMGAYLLSFTGASSAVINFGTSAGNVHPWSSAIYWGTGANSGTSSIAIPYTSTSATVPCTGTASNSCGTAANWGSGHSMFQVRSRTADSMDVYSQIRYGY
jgi:Bacterial Ig domain